MSFVRFRTGANHLRNLSLANWVCSSKSNLLQTRSFSNAVLKNSVQAALSVKQPTQSQRLGGKSFKESYATIPSPSPVINTTSLPNFTKETSGKNTITETSRLAGLTQNVGQPSHMTHPHLMKPDELMVGMPRTEFEMRRAQFMSKLPEGSVAIIMGHRLKYRSNNIFYPFHQNPNLLYLTGFNQPDAVLVLSKNDSLMRGYRMAMFVPPKDPEVELWDGAKCGIENAMEHFMADEAYDITQFTHIIKPILSKAGAIYLDLPKAIEVSTPEHTITNYILQHKLSSKVKQARSILDEIRCFKSSAEVALIKRAGDIAAYSFIEVMEQTGKAAREDKRISEHDIASQFEAQSRKMGSLGHAYVPVVAGGSNALTLHYVSNDQLLRQGDLVMTDAGSFYHGYGSDITRTWPVSGKFTAAQKELYSVVLSVQKKCIQMCTVESRLSLNDILFHSVDLLQKELLSIGFDVTSNEVHRRLYPHHVSHYLGLDIHDTPSVSRTRKLERGMVVTIEPGVYIPDEPAYPARFRGMGIRIEDDVLVTDGAPVVLSATAPKEIEDIEFVCSGGRINSSPILF
ncbi:aminopeptidase [Entomophthora muscae]|uniref:Aminopeptidase n=2 Tax=Entomophthora muscae TaxID=34485 RepID=A0ACC2UKT1_9FUNG|nr:aminopeptidase [Entomophthora muscae]